MANKTLYSFTDENGKTTFGTHVGTNSQNLFILEVKGRQDYVVKSPKELEEVLPYTFSVIINNQEVHYVGTPDKIKKGDFFLVPAGNSYCIARVKDVDTKNKGARAKMKGHRLITEEI